MSPIWIDVLATKLEPELEPGRRVLLAVSGSHPRVLELVRPHVGAELGEEREVPREEDPQARAGR